MNPAADIHVTIERFDMLIQLAEEHLEYVRGTVYEGYAEGLLDAVLAERDEYIARMMHSN